MSFTPLQRPTGGVVVFFMEGRTSRKVTFTLVELAPVSRGKRSAFTLVELLVVIGIIAVLMSMLMPALTRAREEAQQVQCASQLRQVGNGMMAYASNNRGFYPGWSGWQVWGDYGTTKDGVGEDDAGPAWTELLIPYMGNNTKVYHCPSFPDEQTFDYFNSVRWIYYWTRMVPPAQRIPTRTNLKVSDIKFASNFILSGDCNQPNLYPGSFLPYRVDKTEQDADHDDSAQQGILFPGQDDYGRLMHHAGNNILFGDGHVMPYKEFDPSFMTYDPVMPGIDWKQFDLPHTPPLP